MLVCSDFTSCKTKLEQLKDSKLDEYSFKIIIGAGEITGKVFTLNRADLGSVIGTLMTQVPQE